MNKTIIGVAVAGLVLAGAGIGAWAQSSLVSRGATDNAEAVETSSRRAILSPLRVDDMDGTRTIAFNVSSTEGFFQFLLPEDCDIDMGTMIISNGFWSSGDESRFGMAISRGSFQVASATSKEYGTTSVTFPKPLKLRAGVHTVVGFLGPVSQGSPIAPVEVTFIGTVPNANIDSLSVH